MPSYTPTPPRSSNIDRDVTPELRSNRSHSHRAPTEERERERSHRADSYHASSHKTPSHRRSTREYTPDEDDEEEARRRRRRRERERAEEDAISDPEERRARRSERKDRERAEEEDRYGRRGELDGGDSKRRRDRSRDSHRSRESGRERERERSTRDDRPSREQREYERQQRERAMQDERREREEYRLRNERERPGRDRRDERSPPRRRRRHSPSYDPNGGRAAEALLDEIDSEARSVCVSQLAAKLTSRDLGMFFEDKLGEGAVRDAKVVTDRISRRSKGIGYVELDALELVERALKLSGEVVMGLPILVELTEAERNKQARNGVPTIGPIGTMDGRPAQGPGSLPPLQMGGSTASLPARPAAGAAVAGGPLHRDRFAGAEIPYHRLYVGSLHFDLTAEDLKQVFAPFGEIEFVDLHREPLTGKSKGFCFVQYFDVEAAKTALATMNGFELAGRQLRVSTVNEKSGPPGSGPPRPAVPYSAGGALPLAGTGANASAAGEGNRPESLEEHHGQRMDHNMRQQLMMKLARQDVPPPTQPMMGFSTPAAPPPRPNVPVQPSVYVLVSNVFDPAEETEKDWDTDLADDIKGEVEAKYGPVLRIKVEKESQGEVYIQFDSLDSSAKGVAGLNGRFFGGRSLAAHFLPEILFKAHLD